MSSITFSDEENTIFRFHNQPLYVMAIINEMDFPRTILDGRALVNIMPLKSFKEATLKKTRLVKESFDT